MNGRSERRVLGLKGDALVISITEFIHDSGLHLTRGFWSLYPLNLGGSLTVLGLFGLITGLGSIIFQPLCGYISDKFGRKKPVVVGGFIVAAGPFLEAIATHWTGLIPGRILESVDGGLWSARQALFADSADPERRGVSFATFYTIMSLTASIMPVMGGIFLDVVGISGMRILLAVAGLVRVVQSILNAKFLREEPRTIDDDGQGRISAGRGVSLSFRGVIREMFEPVAAQRTLQVMIITSTVASISMGLVESFNVIYVTEFIGISKTEWGLVQSVSGILNMLLRIPLGSVTDRYGRRLCILVDYVFRPVYTLMFVHVQGFTQLLTLNALNIPLQDIGSSAWQALIADVAPAEKRGRLYGTFGMTRSIFHSIAPSMGAILWETHGPVSTFYVVAVVRFLAAVFVFLFLEEPRVREL